jgi:hypothetical protein
MKRRKAKAWEEKAVYWLMWAKIISQITIIIGFFIVIILAFIKFAG